MRIDERLAGEMEVVVRRVTTPDARMPASPVLQAALLPDAARVIEGVVALVGRHEKSSASA